VTRLNDKSYLLLLLLHVGDQMAVGFDFGAQWRRRRRRMLLLLLLLVVVEGERRVMGDDSCSGGGGCRALVVVVMFNIQLVAAAHRPGFQQGQTAMMLIAAHQFLTRWMAFALIQRSAQKKYTEADRARIQKNQTKRIKRKSKCDSTQKTRKKHNREKTQISIQSESCGQPEKGNIEEKHSRR
jgi:hypothetical protein